MADLARDELASATLSLALFQHVRFACCVLDTQRDHEAEIARLREALKDCEKRQVADRKSALDNYAKLAQAEARVQALEKERVLLWSKTLEAQVAALIKDRNA